MKYRSREELVQAKELALLLLRSGNSPHFVHRYLGETYTHVYNWAKEAGLQVACNSAQTGKDGEQLVYRHLRNLGFSAELMPVGHPFDIRVGPVRLEVKTCASVTKFKDQRLLNFFVRARRPSLYGHVYAKSYREDCDFLIAVWLMVPKPIFWVIPAEVVPRGLTITVSNYPKASRKYAQYEGRFDLISKSLDVAVAA